MTTETEKSPREIANEIAVKWGPMRDVVNLGDAIEKALRDRDERAAKIADERALFNARMRDGYKRDHQHKFADLKDTRRDEAEIIASAIRGKS